MSRHSKQKKQRKQNQGILPRNGQLSLATDAYEFAQLFKSLNVRAVTTWGQRYSRQYGEHQFEALFYYTVRHHPDEYDIYYTQVVLPEELKQRGIRPEDATITRIADASGRKKTLIQRKR